ncbi:ATP-binding cassette domain-containing protein [Streptosporangium lutulentum]
MTSPVKAVEALGITKRFGPTTALNGAGIAITEGETHALVGRNGAGKSTLVSILTGLQRPDEGEVRFGGQPAPPLADRDAWRQRVACVYQKSTIIPSLTVAENLFLNRQTDRGAINWRAMRTRARQLLEQYGVEVDANVLAATSTSSSASSWRSPGRCRSAPGSSSWTSPPPSSTARPSSGSSTGCAPSRNRV